MGIKPLHLIAMNLQTLLGDVPLQQFVAEHYHRLPYSRSGSARGFSDLGSWETLTSILAKDDADVLVCRRNEQLPIARLTTTDEARRLVDDGFTLLVRNAERHDTRLQELAAAFEADLAGPVNIHMYCTPAEQFGFGWHYDAEEVFIIQTTGRKEYSLRKNTVNPWPVEETLPADMRYEREIMPLMKCDLRAGDWLYIPSGYWHMGQSSETAISLAIGVLPQTGIDVFDFLRAKILDSLFWRQRLPTTGRGSPLDPDALKATLHQLFADFGRDMAKLLADPKLVDEWLKQSASTYNRKLATEETKQ